MKLKHLKPTEIVTDKLRLYKISFCFKKKPNNTKNKCFLTKSKIFETRR